MEGNRSKKRYYLFCLFPGKGEHPKWEVTPLFLLFVHLGFGVQLMSDTVNVTSLICFITHLSD